MHWRPKDWSVFGKKARTNNDCEGLHHLWNQRARPKLPFYQLVDHLYTIASEIPLQAKLIGHKKLKKEQKLSIIEKNKVRRLLGTLSEERVG